MTAFCKRIPFVVLLICFFRFAACQTRKEVILTGKTMGTTYRIRVVPDNKQEQVPDKAHLQNLIEKRLEKIDDLMSTYNNESEISLFNKTQSTSPVKISKELLDVLSLADNISKLSEGAFDITVGPMVNAYGFGAGTKAELSEETIASLKRLIGYKKISINSEESTVQKSLSALYLDLSGIAKGYGVDQIALLLEREGFTNYLVEIGGEIRVRGNNRKGIPWRIGVEKPLDLTRSVQRVLKLKDTAVATSGDYRNFIRKDGKRISHTIDPRTGRTISHNLASVTVIDKICAKADALATALLVLGPEKGFLAAEEHKIAAIFIIRKSKNGFQEKVTSHFN